MNNINGINGYQSPQVLRTNSTNNTNAQATPSSSNSLESDDQVEISSMAQYFNQISELPEVRADKVESIRQAINNGTYDIDGNLSEALDNFLEENLFE